jgi:thioredoxin reductase (NADPH)
VTLVVRADRLDAHMADYLVREIRRHDNVEVRLGTDIADGDGGRLLEAVRVRERASGTEATLATRALFVLIGADPHTDWLAGTVTRDGHGFLVTGRDLERAGSGWVLDRPPLPFETSVPGVFAIATCAAAPASGWSPPSGKGQRSSPRSTTTWARNTTIAWSLASTRRSGATGPRAQRLTSTLQDGPLSTAASVDFGAP